MKLLAFTLLIISLAGTVFVGQSYVRAMRGAKLAEADGEHAAGDAKDYQIVDDMQMQSVQERLQTDQLRLHTAQTEEHIAEMTGKSPRHAEAEEQRERDLVALDENFLQVSNESRLLGPSKRVSDALDRANACAKALKVWQAVEARDEHLGYGLAGLWVATGFAFALSSQRRHSPQ